MVNIAFNPNLKMLFGFIWEDALETSHQSRAGILSENHGFPLSTPFSFHKEIFHSGLGLASKCMG
jgi:hypothetical protein